MNEIDDIIESFEFEIDDGGPDASNICVPIDDVKKLIRDHGKLRAENARLVDELAALKGAMK